MVCLLLPLQDAAHVSLPLMFCSLAARVFWNILAWLHPVPLELQRPHALNTLFIYHVDSVHLLIRLLLIKGFSSESLT